MSMSIPDRHPLCRLFAALTEQTFIETLGVGDPKLTGYLAKLLVRFVHMDAIWKLCSEHGDRLEEVAEMLVAADDDARSADSTREVHRHIGDFTLFWSGAYPDALRDLRASLRKDHLVDYRQQGKRSYWIASQYDDEPYRDEAAVLRQLSEQFELCAYGLGQVRREWEKCESSGRTTPVRRVVIS